MYGAEPLQEAVGRHAGVAQLRSHLLGREGVAAQMAWRVHEHERRGACRGRSRRRDARHSHRVVHGELEEVQVARVALLDYRGQVSEHHGLGVAATLVQHGYHVLRRQRRVVEHASRLQSRKLAHELVAHALGSGPGEQHAVEAADLQMQGNLLSGGVAGERALVDPRPRLVARVVVMLLVVKRHTNHCQDHYQKGDYQR